MIHFIYLIALGLVILWALHSRWEEREDWRRQVLHERKMRLIAESAFEVLTEAWAEQFAMNRYRVSEAARAIRKTPVGGDPN